ncbi:hypothetical protein [Bartonella sp. AD13SXNS]|uniref:hypothetical protein n=1 Tax=Bartonella sp. AD13SXNS TaxID=3243462 RepID=UPI0035CFAD57
MPFMGVVVKRAWERALGYVSLKKPGNMQLKCIICLGRFVLYNGRDSIKEREKQKHEAMRNLHY